MKRAPRVRSHYACRSQGGLTLIELMIALTVSLLVLAGLVSLFVNTSRSNIEMEKTNDLIEDGRISIQLLSLELVHAGFWGGYLPQFDDLTYSNIPGDAPTAVPDPCQAYNTWDSTYRGNILGIAVQTYDTVPAGSGCLSPLVQHANTDVLVVRHMDTCLPVVSPAVGNCDPDAAGKLYFQVPLCATEQQATAQGGTATSIELAATASNTHNAYQGATIRTLSGTGAGQARVVTTYNGGTQTATVDAAWTTIPDTTTTYAIEYVLGTNAYPLHNRDCTTVADKRRFISDIYYVSDLVSNGQTIPTLVRSQLDVSGGTLAHLAPVALIDGVEGFKVVLGIDNISKTGAAVDNTSAIVWADPTTKITATNRGDGAPDTFMRCTTAAPCTAAQLSNVVAVKLYVLTRSRDTTPGYTDTKTYCLGEPAADGSCPAASVIAAANDHYKRHVFVTSVRLTNISGRRDTP
jgi:Tfp pilus assembly protein PilW